MRSGTKKLGKHCEMLHEDVVWRLKLKNTLQIKTIHTVTGHCDPLRSCPGKARYQQDIDIKAKLCANKVESYPNIPSVPHRTPAAAYV